MLIDCDTCRIRGEGCTGCVVELLLRAPAAPAPPPPVGATVLAQERQAVAVLAACGLLDELDVPLDLLPIGWTAAAVSGTAEIADARGTRRRTA